MNRIYLIFIAIAVTLMLMLAGCSKKIASDRAYEASSAIGASSPATKAEAATGRMASSPAKDKSPEAPAKIAESRSKVASKPTRPAPGQPREGLLTAGEWNDNKNYTFLMDLMEANPEWKTFAENWNVDVSRRLVTKVKAGNGPAVNAEVKLMGDHNQVLWVAKTDNTGVAYLFNGLGRQAKGVPKLIRVTSGKITQEQKYNQSGSYTFNLSEPQTVSKSLDLMLMVDTTGSMGDELEFLKTELEDVIKRIRHDNANIPVRLSVNFYRDAGDEYVVRSTPFKKDIKEPLEFLAKQSANGGGDYEEAVEKALADAINQHDWQQEATARLLFLVLDAPPHNTDKIRAEMHDLIEDAAAKGIRVIPVASSGVDKNTEFLLRTLALSSGGSYVFLTDDSGVGNSHIKPTIGAYEVEPLNDLLVRLANQYLR